REIAVLLRDRGEKTLAVGQISGPATLSTNAGPGIRLILGQELKCKGLTVQRQAEVGVKGEYQLDRTAEHGGSGVTLKLLAEDRAGKRLWNWERTVFGPAALAPVFGLTAHLPPRGSDKNRSRIIEARLEKPRFYPKGPR